MSLFTFTQGLSQGNAESIAARRNANSAVSEWENYSNNLAARLAEAEKKSVCSAAREARRDAQQRALREALAKLDPTHPLLDKLPVIGDEAMVASFSRHGYIYDLETDELYQI